LATQLQIARPTAERYFALLEQTLVSFRLPAFRTNPRQEIAKSQEVFVWDTGIRNALLNTFSADEFRPDIGSLWGNGVIAEVAKGNALLGSKVRLEAVLTSANVLRPSGRSTSSCKRSTRPTSWSPGLKVAPENSTIDWRGRGTSLPESRDKVGTMVCPLSTRPFLRRGCDLGTLAKRPFYQA
jgi:hypothetical protein